MGIENYIPLMFTILIILSSIMTFVIFGMLIVIYNKISRVKENEDKKGISAGIDKDKTRDN
jgi:hypothetical protein